MFLLSVTLRGTIPSSQMWVGDLLLDLWPWNGPTPECHYWNVLFILRQCRQSYTLRNILKKATLPMNCLENNFFPDDDPQLLLNYELTELIKFIAWICGHLWHTKIEWYKCSSVAMPHGGSLLLWYKHIVGRRWPPGGRWWSQASSSSLFPLWQPQIPATWGDCILSC